MSNSLSSLEIRANIVAQQWGIVLTRLLGHGIDGNVWQTSRLSALKVFAQQETYERERECYRRLLENRIEQLAGFHVPELLDYDNR